MKKEEDILVNFSNTFIAKLPIKKDEKNFVYTWAYKILIYNNSKETIELKGIKLDIINNLGFQKNTTIQLEKPYTIKSLVSFEYDGFIFLQQSGAMGFGSCLIEKNKIEDNLKIEPFSLDCDDEKIYMN